MIPEKLKVEGIRFVLLEKSGKKPFQEKWQKKIISFSNPELLTHISKGGNYGVMGGGNHNLIIIDFDSEIIQDKLINKLPETFTVKTGSGMLHKYYFSDASKSFKIFNNEMMTALDVQGEGKQVVGAGSTHPNGKKYEVVEDKDIAFISHSELQALILPLDRKPKKEKSIEFEKPTDYLHDNFLDTVKQTIKIEDILNQIGVDTSKNPSNCPFHDSKGGKCLGWEREVAHCFHCDGAWNIFSLVKEYRKCDFREALLWIVDTFNLHKEHEESRKQYLKYLNSSESNEKNELRERFLELVSGKDKKISEATEILVEHILKKYYIYTTKDDNKSEIWIYKNGIYIPQGRTEIKIIMRDILGKWFNSYYYNQVIDKIEPDTSIDSREFFKINYIEEIPVQNGILNILTKKLCSFSPDKIFFSKLPVEYEPEATCPSIDSFLSDVLSTKEDKLVVYELAGFGLMKEYRFEKAFMMVGNGRNGKGKLLELLKRLLGAENCCAIPLSSLIPDSFQLSELFGKFLNLAGDIGNNDLKDTSMFKSTTGRDLITTKRKFLSGLSFENYAKFVFACNDLPTVYDTSRGFWDRWVLMEFPYTFVTKEELDNSSDKTNLKLKDDNIINKIVTPQELSGFLNKSLDSLQNIIKNGNFSVTKGTKEIKDIWIRKANSFMAFALDCITEDYDNYITKKELRKKYYLYCKKHNVNNKSDFVIKKVLQESYGVVEERIMIEGYQNNNWQYVWQGIKWK